MSTTPTTASLGAMCSYFNTGATRSVAFRKSQLQKLYLAIQQYESQLHAALKTDLNRAAEEAYVTETGFVLAEISFTLKRLRKWMKPQSVSTNLVNFPSTSRIVQEPLGLVLIIAPWNYPFQLLFSPLVGAIAAGNCVVLKPSEFAPATEAVMKKMIEEHFEPQYIRYAAGEGAKLVPEMMQHVRFDHVFYTGSTTVGKEIYRMAAEKLVPVTLELGGKSPCLVLADANLKVAARRIVMTKFSNAGQTCVAPDYLLVEASVKDELINALRETINSFFSENPAQCSFYGKIINQKQFKRLRAYLDNAAVLHGGRVDERSLYIEPTLVESPSMDDAIMKEEIFGPLLPILSFKNREEAAAIIAQNPNPLAFYIYTGSRESWEWWLENVPAGGACVNNSSWHLTNPHLPFGGRGFSGFGAYHGQHSFLCFSHAKAVMRSPTWFDPALKYPPLDGKLGFFRRLMH